MAKLYSNELKAFVVSENFLDNPKNVLKEHCLSVQHFDYDCVHKRNDSDEVYGATEPVILSFTVRVNSPVHSRVFYRNLVSNAHYNYSFLFNATFNAYQRLGDYDDGMVVNGYVVSVEEKFSTDRDEAGQSEQILLDVKLLVRSVTYLGREEQNNLKSVFIQ